ncbi:sporulation histidine kinase inhibitor Sda [Paenibacillus sp. J2TS4]|uniref:sporulation histidine kinase inhibitor Sda n=1 Tax=Paenibacillus sp. J2TS4 TaxID=2807194 RepID=UPI001B220A80|nr:sporulation histidine kinase inhibitor Sda [Paenibacillus sp. J2TS4]GIP32989.1 hypothetical protein J2TS4_21990 [Paenibacillus sp. J2TS4]
MSDGRFVQTPEYAGVSQKPFGKEEVQIGHTASSKTVIRESWKNIASRFSAKKSSYDWVEALKCHYDRSPRPSALETLDNRELMNIYRLAVDANTSNDFIELILKTLRGRNVDVVEVINSR